MLLGALFVGLLMMGGLGLAAYKLRPLVWPSPVASAPPPVAAAPVVQPAPINAPAEPAVEPPPTEAPAEPVVEPVVEPPADTATEPVVEEPPADTAANPDADMQVQLDGYYRLINDKQLDEAYQLRSSRSKNTTSLAEFKKIWSNNRSLQLIGFEISEQSPDRAVVQIRLQADDIDLNSGTSAVKVYAGTVKLTLEDGRWCYDGGDFQAE